jgi:hypothetical protein
MPAATTVEECLAAIAEFKRRGQQGLLGIEEVTALITWEAETIKAIEGTVNERDLKLVESTVLPAEPIPVRTVVASSVPALPGTDITMPDVSEPPRNGPWSSNPAPPPEPKDESK